MAFEVNSHSTTSTWWFWFILCHWEALYIDTEVFSLVHQRSMKKLLAMDFRWFLFIKHQGTFRPERLADIARRYGLNEEAGCRDVDVLFQTSTFLNLENPQAPRGICWCQFDWEHLWLWLQTVEVLRLPELKLDRMSWKMWHTLALTMRSIRTAALGETVDTNNKIRRVSFERKPMDFRIHW